MNQHVFQRTATSVAPVRKAFRIQRPSSASPNFAAIDLRKEISKAEFVLIGAGAGFSVDSGLKTFLDIAKVPQYEQRGLTYDELCQPTWLLRDYKLFYGFWGSCYNQYMDSQPHSGYYNLINCLRAQRKDFFVYTSNIDGFFAKLLQPREFFEVHGQLRYWQCSVPCCQRIYSFPAQFRFKIDAAMLCTNAVEDDCVYEPNLDECVTVVRTHSIPRCQQCHMFLRPHVLMFDDSHYLEDAFLERSFRKLKQRLINKKLLILEFGCGTKVPHVRQQMEYVMRQNKCYSLMLRVNPKDLGLQKATRQNDCKLRIKQINSGAEAFLRQLQDELTQEAAPEHSAVE